MSFPCVNKRPHQKGYTPIPTNSPPPFWKLWKFSPTNTLSDERANFPCLVDETAQRIAALKPVFCSHCQESGYALYVSEIPVRFGDGEKIHESPHTIKVRFGILEKQIIVLWEKTFRKEKSWVVDLSSTKKGEGANEAYYLAEQLSESQVHSL